MEGVNWAGFAQSQRENEILNSPINQFARGFKIGSIMREQNTLNEARVQEIEKKKTIGARQQQFMQDMAGLYDLNDSMMIVDGLDKMRLKYPDFNNNLDGISKSYDERAKREFMMNVYPAYHSIMTGNKEVALNQLNTVKQAYESGGNKKGAAYVADAISGLENSTDLKDAIIHGGILAMGYMGPDEFFDNVKKSQGVAKEQSVMPGEIGKVQSEATIKAEEANRAPLETQLKQAELGIKQTQAKFEGTKQAQELEQRGWNIAKLKNDIDVSRQNSRIAAMNASLARESNDIKRQELGLKLQDAIAKRDETARQKVADVESARLNMDNMLSTAQKVIDTPLDVIKAATGPVDSSFFTLQPNVADFESLIENLQSQAFLAQIPNIKGMGALSNVEGDKLQAALQNFSLKQSPAQLLANVKEAQRLILKGRKNLAERYGVPDTDPDFQSDPASRLNFEKMTEIQRAAKEELDRRGVKRTYTVKRVK